MVNSQEKLGELIERGKAIQASCLKTSNPCSSRLAVPATISGAEFEKWKAAISLFTKHYLDKHLLFNDICMKIDDLKNGWIFTLDKILGHLQVVYDDDDFFGLQLTSEDKEGEGSMAQLKNVFIVHGHDEEAISKAESFVRKMGSNPIILRDQASKGKTIIEKFETYANVDFAIILYTPCDEMKDKKFRARQNVVLEHGYLMGKLGRERVAALVKDAVETPGDIDGVVYITMDSAKGWEFELAKEMRAAGFDADANKI